MLTSIC